MFTSLHETEASPPLLAADEPPPVTVRHAQGRARLVFSCDHASNRIPRRFGDLGLTDAQRADHIAWDIGAARVAEHLSDAFDAPAVFSGYSRLILDCNRRPDDPSAMPAMSDGVAIEANRDLSPAARAARIATFFAPFQEAVAAMMARAQPGAARALISVHSFTPRMKGFDRPWHVGALWERDDVIAGPFMAALVARGDVVVGDNLPYSFSQPRGATLDAHAFEKNIPCMGIEVRQDLIASEEGAARWAGILADALRTPLATLGALASQGTDE
jgi:predicted N-formylglutamate amidohydrolase